MNGQAGKGDKPRKVKGDIWRQNYDKIFKKNAGQNQRGPSK